MPDAKDNAKMTGDTHLPDAESDLDVQHGRTGVGAEGGPRGRPGASEDASTGRGAHKGGEIKDRDATTSHSDGDTRDTGGGKQ